jgi:hypothetical protein
MVSSKSDARLRRSAGLAAALGLALFWGCTPTKTPTVVYADPTEMASLAGVWNGQYWSADTGRSGTIRFELAADGSGAWGDVSLIAPSRADHTPANPRPPGEASAQTLAIRFVRAGEGTVSGTLEPYRDPDCGCVLSTTFVGRRDGRIISGTFVSNGGPGHVTTHGQWRAERMAPEHPGGG